LLIKKQSLNADFDTSDDAQDYLNQLCIDAGTNDDPYYVAHGPAVINE